MYLLIRKMDITSTQHNISVCYFEPVFTLFSYLPQLNIRKDILNLSSLFVFHRRKSHRFRTTEKRSLDELI